MVGGHARGLHFGEVGCGGAAGVGDSCGGSSSSLWSPSSHICPPPPAHHHRGLPQNFCATSRRHREFAFAAATLRHALSQGRSPIGWTRPNRVPSGGTSAHASANEGAQGPVMNFFVHPRPDVAGATNTTNATERAENRVVRRSSRLPHVSRDDLHLCGARNGSWSLYPLTNFQLQNILSLIGAHISSPTQCCDWLHPSPPTSYGSTLSEHLHLSLIVVESL